MVTRVLLPSGEPAPSVPAELPFALLETTRPVGRWVYDRRAMGGTLFTTAGGEFERAEQYDFHGSWSQGEW